MRALIGALVLVLGAIASAAAQAPDVAYSVDGVSLRFEGWSRAQPVGQTPLVPVILEIHAASANLFRACQLHRQDLPALGATQDVVNQRISRQSVEQLTGMVASRGHVHFARAVTVNGVAVLDYESDDAEHGMVRMRGREFFYVRGGTISYYDWMCAEMATASPVLRANTDAVVNSLHFDQ